MNENNNQTEETAIKILAAASKTPFKTAFLATMGVAAAQLALGLVFLGGVVLAISALVYFLGK